MVDQKLRKIRDFPLQSGCFVGPKTPFATTPFWGGVNGRISSQVEKQTVRNVTQMMALKRMVESGMFASHIRHSAEFFV